MYSLTFAFMSKNIAQKQSWKINSPHCLASLYTLKKEGDCKSSFFTWLIHELKIVLIRNAVLCPKKIISLKKRKTFLIDVRRHSNKHTTKLCKVRSKFWWFTKSAIRITYRISLRSSSLREPRHPSLKIFFSFKIFIKKKSMKVETFFLFFLQPHLGYALVYKGFYIDRKQKSVSVIHTSQLLTYIKVQYY